MNSFPLSDAAVIAHSSGREDILADNFDDLYDFYLKNGEMPYGVAKARTDDPYNWIADQLNLRATEIRLAREQKVAPKEYVSENATYENPIWYRGYRIFNADYVPMPDARFSYVHDDYDGPEDGRAGYGGSVADCIAEIDEREDD